MVSWHHLVVHLENKGRKVSENGVLVNVHTKKKDMTSLPRNMWNAKGKKMMEAAKGQILNEYGSKGWEFTETFELDKMLMLVFRRELLSETKEEIETKKES